MVVPRGDQKEEAICHDPVIRLPMPLWPWYTGGCGRSAARPLGRTLAPRAPPGTSFPLDHLTGRTRQHWCDRCLDAARCKHLHAVMRAARRDASQTRTVRLSTRASALLHDLAEREQLTLSETIEGYPCSLTAI
jgi:hypothetical protein